MLKKLNYKWRILSKNWKPEIRHCITLFINWTDYIIVKSFYIIKRVKRNPHARRKYCSTHRNGKGFIPTAYVLKKKKQGRKRVRWGRGVRERGRERFKCILFNGWIILHCVYVPQLCYPFICWWTSRLLPCPGYYKQCCDEHWGTRERKTTSF